MSETPRIIGLYSPAPGSGKTAVARYLSCHGFTTVSFATPMKEMVRTLLRAYGLSSDAIHMAMGAAKEEPIPEIGVSARHLCQTLGTEWGRACIHPEVWVRAWQRTAEKHLAAGTSVVSDDCRFPNEARTIRALGGELWLIQRPSVMRTTTHASEGGLDNITFDHVICNDSSLFSLYEQVACCLARTQTFAA